MLQEKNRGLIFNIQRFSIHDGPGIRTTVFFKGCPLRCRWCSNPESICAHQELMTYDSRCIKCRQCMEVCAGKAISFVNDMRVLDRSLCDLCLKCAETCPSGAIEIVGTYYSVDELMREVKKDSLFYINSGGGVTFSGGEPLSQGEFLKESLKACRAGGIHTALDTTGYAPWPLLEQVLDYVDLVLYDLKHLDPDIHKGGTGITNEIILKNLSGTLERKKTWIRIPVIPEFNDNEAFTESLLEFVSTCNRHNLEKVSLLPYHNWGEQKYERLGQAYPYKDIVSTGKGTITRLEEILTSTGLKVSIGR